MPKYIMPDNYAVVGNPIEHSKSPFIHQQFASQTGEDIEYSKILVPLGEFEKEIKAFFNSGGKGLNITVPFKIDAFNFADNKNERVQFAQAANTLIKNKDGTISCDNTDGIGIIRDLQKNQNIILKGKRILILGAGGAVQGVLQPILNCQPSLVFIANRTVSKAKQLSEYFSALGYIKSGGFDDTLEQEFDIIINGTAASLFSKIPRISESLIHKNIVCYDMMYGTEATVFNNWAQQRGAGNVSDGLGMLVEQAAESFYLWRGVRPETETIIKMIREGKAD